MTEIPDGEAVVTAYLKQQTDQRVVGRTPDNRSAPWVRITLIDAPSAASSHPDHLIAFLFQFDCYAGDREEGGQAEASSLVRSVRAALIDMEGQFGEATVNGARIVSMPRVPDTSIEPARERFVLTARVYMHS
jgi:hypothetical protein